MKSLKNFILIIIILIVLVFIIFARPVLNNFYFSSRMFLKGLFSDSINFNDYNELVRENEQLKFEINNLKNKEVSEDGILVDVYSRYPFNDKERLILDIGEKDGSKIGLPVFTKNDFLLGKIINVNGRYSEVQTIFDSEWKTSVGLNNLVDKAVMKGGQPPKVELISKDSEVEKGDYIFSISPDFPYKTLIGKLSKITEVDDHIWDSSLIDVPYNVDDLSKVKVILNFP